MSTASVADRPDRNPAAALTLTSAALIDLLPLPDPSGQWPMPSCLLCVLFYWSLARPVGVPALLLLALGILADAASGMPPGPTAIALLGARAASRALRRVLLEQPSFVIWSGFLLIAALYQATRWALASLALGHLFPLRLPLLELLSSLLAYPVAAALLSRLCPKARRRASRA